MTLTEYHSQPVTSTRQLAAFLAGWRPSPAAVVMRPALAEALETTVDTAAIYANASAAMMQLCERFGIDKPTAAETFGLDLLAAAVVAEHRHRPAFLHEQIKRTEHFLSQPNLRLRQMIPQPRQTHDDAIIRINADGTVERSAA